MTPPEHDPADSTNTALDLANRFQAALLDFQAAYPLDQAQRDTAQQQLQPYVRTIADACTAGIFHDDSPTWITYLNSSAYSAMRITMVLTSYCIDDADLCRLRDRAVQHGQNLIQFAEAKTLDLHTQVDT